MKERGILFSAPMVKALLAGTKTQTRRIMKPQPISNAFGPPDPVHDIPCHCDGYPPSAMLWPDENGGMLNADAGHPWFGVDRLWVKETYAPCRERENHEHAKAGYTYRADWSHEDEEAARDFHWKPSIFCTRAASRITLEITDVRAERLNNITEADAKAEGVTPAPQNHTTAAVAYIFGAKEFLAHTSAYATLWEAINGVGSWKANPWVWVISFRRITP